MLRGLGFAHGEISLGTVLDAFLRRADPATFKRDLAPLNDHGHHEHLIV